MSTHLNAHYDTTPEQNEFTRRSLHCSQHWLFNCKLSISTSSNCDLSSAKTMMQSECLARLSSFSSASSSLFLDASDDSASTGEPLSGQHLKQFLESLECVQALLLITIDRHKVELISQRPCEFASGTSLGFYKLQEFRFLHGVNETHCV